MSARQNKVPVKGRITSVAEKNATEGEARSEVSGVNIIGDKMITQLQAGVGRPVGGPGLQPCHWIPSA